MNVYYKSKKNIMTKFNPLQILIDGFNKLVSTVKRNGALTSLWAVVIFIVLYTFIINPIDVNSIVQELNDKEKKEHNKSVEKRLIADAAIPEILDNLRIKYDLTRVCLFEMHNNTSSINDISFLYLSMIYESIDNNNDSIDFVSDIYQHQRTSEYSEVIKEMSRKGYLYIPNLKECTDGRFYRLAKKMTINKANSLLLYPLYSGKRLDAMLVFSSVENELPYQDIIIGINKSVAKIKNLIL